MPAALVIGYGPLRSFIGHQSQGLEVVLEKPEPIKDLLDRLGIPSGKVQAILVNGRTATLETVITNGDRIALIPLLGGG